MKRWLLIGGTMGWLLGWGGSLLLENELAWSVPRSGPDTLEPQAASPLHRSDYTEAIAGRDIFNLGSKVTRKKTTWSGPAEEVVLLATVVTRKDQDSSALIRLGEHTEGYGIGDSLSEDITVVDIQPREVTVAYNNELHTYSIARPESGDEVPPMRDDQSRISREELSELVSQSGGGVRAVPHKDNNGAVDGYRVSGIRRKSLLYRIGAKNGDIVHSINGIEITDTEGMMKAYNDLAGTDALKVDVTRRNQRMSLSVAIE